MNKYNEEYEHSEYSEELWALEQEAEEWAHKHKQTKTGIEEELKMWEDEFMTGDVMCHIDNEGNLKHIPVGSEEYWDIIEKLNK